MLSGIFNNSIITANIYHRFITPIRNMVKPLLDNDRKRLCLREAEIKGATAHNSILLDYVLPDLISCIATATSAGHYYVVLSIILATLSNSVYIVLGRLFIFVERDDIGYVHLDPEAARGGSDLQVHVYPDGLRNADPPEPYPEVSRILALDQFRHGRTLKAQILQADRIYRFGVYAGMDKHDYAVPGLGQNTREFTQMTTAVGRRGLESW
ncbi:hypothetical protein BKA59DRAFT_504636 [Fusarium tricinctum]|uniref:Uncharacterized protein n=1 Tax=Fusarium tricinctum TaxID=61284 RepID=A0A8K0WGA5_9HYPO|nr:hypothetical protein BKA59DRAFT_504636 [Fusarium tricinctum]